MKNAINSVQVAYPKSSAFDLTHDHKLSCNMGELIPVCIIDCVPGDRLRISGEVVVRFAPMLAPIMHRVDVYIHYFFVPNRIVWPNWEQWITNGSISGKLQTGPLPAHPFFEYGAPGSGGRNYTRLMDYMGLPSPTHASGVDTVKEKVSALAFGAYQLTASEYYRDENLADPWFEPLPDGNCNDVGGLFEIRKRAWEADYFTKALPWAQKGEAVDIPLGEITLDPDWDGEGDGRIPKFVNGMHSITTGQLSQTDPEINASGGDGMLAYDPDGTLQVDATTLNDLRTAWALQAWLEKNARGGTRYSELIRAHFGVRPEDARLQRPEYIVGVKNPVQISEVLNTTGETLPQGNMSGHGASYTKGKFGKYFCTEHGHMIGIMSILPKPAYMQGIPRMFKKYTHPTEIFWPEFANLGEQEIKNSELFAFSDTPDGTFGYMARYQEYKTMQSRVSGDFRTQLDYWHMARKFDNLPQLNIDFVTSDPTHRIFAVTDPTVQKMYCHVQNDILAIRPMPVFGTPSTF